MKNGDYLFVYGTLRRGQSADLANNRKVIHVGQDRINGEMFHLGWYPGVKSAVPGAFNPSLPAVVGDLFRIRDESITPVLDAYEGYPSLYDRVETTTESGLTAWVYYYVPIPLGVPLKSGDWVTGQLAGPEELFVQAEMGELT